jgi:DNA replicative helicase MCM subunit Mcm2 (Cdc46/Mcm family)
VKAETEDIDFEILWRSVAPTVIGHEIEKKTLLLQMAGTKRRKFDDGTISRGPNNLLFCGSPATAKTVLANYQKRVFHRAVAPTGDGLSKPGLTAAVDPRSGRSVLKPGAYVLANGGIVVIDELNVIKGDIITALLEPMEDNQTVTISKGGIHRVLDARCASLHMCNPKGTTHWDDNKTIVENTGLHPPQLSRYDAIFVFRDIPDAVEDAKKFDHWTNMYGNSVTDNAYSDEQESMKEQPVILKRGKIGNLHSLPFMAFWRLYISDTFDAKLDVSADSKPLQMLREFYLEMRNMDMTRFMSLDELEDQDEATIQRIPSITMRQIGSLIRLAEASANAHHRNIVMDKDAELAIEIVRYSILNSGFNQALNKAGIVDYAQRGGNPKVSYIEIAKFANIKRDRWHKESVKLFKTFEQQLKRYAIGKCLNCRGTGVKTLYQNMKEIQQDCSVCGGLGSENLEFNLDHIRDNLKPRGYTLYDFEYVADTFLKYRIIERNPRTGYYRLVKRYSITHGYGTVKFLEGIVAEDIVDVGEAEQKTKELGQLSTVEERDAMIDTMKRLEENESDGETE